MATGTGGSSSDEVNTLLAAPKKWDLWWKRDRAVLELLYATGCRVSELSRLRPRDVHLKDRHCLCHGKGDKQRLVPLGGPAVAAVSNYLEGSGLSWPSDENHRRNFCCCLPGAGGCDANGSGSCSKFMRHVLVMRRSSAHIHYDIVSQHIYLLEGLT